MCAHGLIEAINVVSNGFDFVISGLEYSAPDQFRLDPPEDSYHHCIVIPISFVAHGWKHFVSQENSSVLIKVRLQTFRQ